MHRFYKVVHRSNLLRRYILDLQGNHDVVRLCADIFQASAQAPPAFGLDGFHVSLLLQVNIQNCLEKLFVRARSTKREVS